MLDESFSIWGCRGSAGGEVSCFVTGTLLDTGEGAISTGMVAAVVSEKRFRATLRELTGEGGGDEVGELEGEYRWIFSERSFSRYDNLGRSSWKEFGNAYSVELGSMHCVVNTMDGPCCSQKWASATVPIEGSTTPQTQKKVQLKQQGRTGGAQPLRKGGAWRTNTASSSL